MSVTHSLPTIRAFFSTTALETFKDHTSFFYFKETFLDTTNILFIYLWITKDFVGSSEYDASDTGIITAK